MFVPCYLCKSDFPIDLCIGMFEAGEPNSEETQRAIEKAMHDGEPDYYICVQCLRKIVRARLMQNSVN